MFIFIQIRFKIQYNGCSEWNVNINTPSTQLIAAVRVVTELVISNQIFQLRKIKYWYIYIYIYSLNKLALYSTSQLRSSMLNTTRCCSQHSRVRRIIWLRNFLIFSANVLQYLERTLLWRAVRDSVHEAECTSSKAIVKAEGRTHGRKCSPSATRVCQQNSKIWDSITYRLSSSWMIFKTSQENIFPFKSIRRSHEAVRISCDVRGLK